MENIIISDINNFNRIKSNFLNGGFNNLHVISDFDRTLTKAFIENGISVPSLISILRDENHLSENYSKKSKELFEKYHPIEIDSKLNIIEKKKYMEMWWSEHFELLIESKLNKNDLKNAAKSNRIKFREKTSQILVLLKKQNVPFVILSANGIGDDSIIYTLKHHNLYFSNIFVISNKYIWDEKGFAIEVKKPYIHTFNKNEASIKTSQIFPLIENRKNVLLLGDSLGDVDMVKGFNYNNLLKIGFLNFDIDKNIEEYKKHYDIIITNDSSMDFVYNFLSEFK